jgi:Zn-dependent M28 family amino/carboxypeptidase
MDHVRALGAEIGYRQAGSEGDVKAARYIAEQIEMIGWEVAEQKFALPQGGESSNVIGKPPGFDERAPYLLVGGHRDSLRGPGANDNATGVALALEVARAVAARPAALPVVFIAFGAEERQPANGRPHHVGSRYFVSLMSEQQKRNLAALINLDMVGRGDLITCGHMSVGPTEGTERCVRLAEDLGIPARERVTPDWSDNGAFLTNGMNAAWLWTGDDPCCIHSPRDTLDRVRPEDVERSGRLALALVRSYS